MNLVYLFIILKFFLYIICSIFGSIILCLVQTFVIINLNRGPFTLVLWSKHRQESFLYFWISLCISRDFTYLEFLHLFNSLINTNATTSSCYSTYWSLILCCFIYSFIHFINVNILKFQALIILTLLYNLIIIRLSTLHFLFF